ncbi:helix-turn-helix transcriptional regulator [Streptomyces sp. NPDC050610]|uniref:helix-turn-helix domain-containing protein n=1 Tax=Streptomyces sp. NPDC050610 TaxID=3157097 RepID=UPI003427FC71
MARGQAGLGNRVSTVLARKLGAELLRLRDAAGLTQPQAAEALSATAAKIAKMERGWVPFRDPDVLVLARLYGLEDPKAVDGLLRLAKLDRERRRAKGWWQHSPSGGGLAEYIAMEDVASRVRSWQLSLVPGLFQTPAYVRSLAVGEGSWDDPNEIERVVEVRTRRQARLTDEVPLQVYAVIWEAALRQVVGGREVMRAQLERLQEVARLPNVRLQVLPFRSGGHPCMAGAFNIVSFAEEEAVDVVHVDTMVSTVWVENETEGAAYRTYFDRTSRLGLSPHDTLSLIDSLHKEM